MNTYSDFVASIVKPGEDIVNEISPDKAQLIHYALGVAGEAGELVDAIKKSTMYNQELDRENVVEELGDIMFYITALVDLLGIDKNYVIQHNIEKLSKRYADGYSNKAAKERKDK